MNKIRVWNYNASRIHCERGARNLTISLDHRVIFRGEIRQAPGHARMEAEKHAEVILFTMDETVLDNIVSLLNTILWNLLIVEGRARQDLAGGY